MTATCSIDQLPIKNPEVVFAQIKTTKDNLEFQCVVKGPLLYLRTMEVVHYTIDSNYVLGTKFNYSLSVKNNVVTFNYNGVNYSYPEKFTTGYFKAGNYMQSNVVTYGEDKNTESIVSYYNLSITH